MMARCSECRFWNLSGDQWHAPGTEASDYEPQPTEKRKCLNVLHANRPSSKEEAERAITAPAVVTDGSGYAAAFWTAPSFACNSFEKG